MSRRGYIGLFTILLILGSSSARIWTASALVDNQDDFNLALNAEGDVEESINAPSTVNMSQLDLYDYYETVKADRRFKWKITELERTENFHLKEGDKKLKEGDKIILIMGGDPWLQRSQPHSWGQIYVNDVMARYTSDTATGRAIFKFLQPVGINYIENFTSTYYNSSEFLNDYENNYNYTDFLADYYGNIYNYTDMGSEGFFNYVETSPFINRTFWTFEENLVTYENTIISEVNNITEITLVFDRPTGLLNEMYYSASFINGSEYFAGVNLTLIRLHGWGLPYYITTWVVWIPIILVVVGIIVAFRLHAFQRLKLYLEARKLAKRD
ncbi:MAG: hypothetical protein GOP50_10900 [Candidatus Heimdallarchaeota archaeon]|nr:hypothetical protein [Candidatus Heimdallarchaeota archaeon]